MALNFHFSNLSKITQAPNSLYEIPFCLIYQESFAFCIGPGCPLSSSVYLPSWCLLHPQWVPDENSKYTGTKKYITGHAQSSSHSSPEGPVHPSFAEVGLTLLPPLPWSLCMPTPPPLYSNFLRQLKCSHHYFIWKLVFSLHSETTLHFLHSYLAWLRFPLPKYIKTVNTKRNLLSQRLVSSSLGCSSKCWAPAAAVDSIKLSTQC